MTDVSEKKTFSQDVKKVELPAVDLRDPALYLNREISWIEFDRKVLETAQDKKVPLIDRVKFLAIFFNNLDEFYMVRVMNPQPAGKKRRRTDRGGSDAAREAALRNP